MKKIYNIFCWVEEVITNTLLFTIMILVFAAAMFRTVGYPLNWAQDAALVAFAWMIFLGSDIAVRGPGLIGIDIFIKRFPGKIQKILGIFFKLIIVVLLAVLVIFGFQMVVDGWAREITTLHISYSWVTLAVPVGSFFMILSTLIRLIEQIKTPTNIEISDEGGTDE